MKKFFTILKYTIIYVSVAVLCLSGSAITDYAVTTIAENSPIANRRSIAFFMIGVFWLD